MVPRQTPNLMQALSSLLPKYNPPANRRKNQYKLSPKARPMTYKAPPISNPFESIIRNITTSLNQITRKPVREDYNAVVKKFLPANTSLLIPQYPAGSKDIQPADLDKDTQDELIASYRQENEIKTIILKKRDKEWYKASEFSNAGFDTINYRGPVNFTGEGGRQLLLALTGKQKAPSMFVYKLENNTSSKILERNYSRFEVLSPSKNRQAGSSSQLAIWNRKDSDLHDIELLHWNGTQVASLNDTAPYYYRSVAPYYANKIKGEPHNTGHWYNLAHSLTKAGAYRDALIATQVGMEMDVNSQYRDDFIALRDEILQH